MNKHNESSTECEMEQPTPAGSWTTPYTSLETLTLMKRSEAREWLSRYRQKTQDVGPMLARAWWNDVIEDIEKRRGEKAATELRYWMNQEK